MLFKFYTENPDILGKVIRECLLIVARNVSPHFAFFCLATISLPVTFILLQSVYPIPCLCLHLPFYHIRIYFSTYATRDTSLCEASLRFVLFNISFYFSILKAVFQNFPFQTHYRISPRLNKQNTIQIQNRLKIISI